jgi:hypothetical protein
LCVLQTIVDDARMILQAASLNGDFTLTSNEKAKALAVISLLSDSSDVEIMKMYLDYFSQALLQLKLSVNFLKDSADISFTTTSSILTETVRLLQSVILDAHILFFREVSNVFPGESFQLNGLISLSKSIIIREVVTAFINSDAPPTPELHYDYFDFSAYFQKNTAQHLGRLKELFNEWLYDTLPVIHYICDEILQLMQSASEVASLQQVVWFRSCHAGDETGDMTTGEDFERFRQRYWEEASREFLQNIKRRRGSGVGDATAARGGSLLWNSVFRVPFVKQVYTYQNPLVFEILAYSLMSWC